MIYASTRKTALTKHRLFNSSVCPCKAIKRAPYNSKSLHGCYTCHQLTASGRRGVTGPRAPSRAAPGPRSALGHVTGPSMAAPTARDRWTSRETVTQTHARVSDETLHIYKISRLNLIINISEFISL